MTDQSVQAAAAGADADAGHGRRTLGIAGLAALATYLDTTILFVAFPDITASFGDSSASTLSWVLNAYTIAFAALLVPAVWMLIGARILQGVGAAILVPASLALVMAAFAREKIPQVIAIWGAIGAMSAALGPSLGGLIVDALRVHHRIVARCSVWGWKRLMWRWGPSSGR